MSFVEDLAIFLADFGVDATWNGLTRKVIFDMPGESELADMQSSTEYTIRFRTADFPGMANSQDVGVGAPGWGTAQLDPPVAGQSVFIGEREYTVRTVRSLDDGAFSRAWLSLV